MFDDMKLLLDTTNCHPIAEPLVSWRPKSADAMVGRTLIIHEEETCFCGIMLERAPLEVPACPFSPGSKEAEDQFRSRIVGVIICIFCFINLADHAFYVVL